ncbi:glycosyltransferase [Lignipirellula cremea]|nr:glycosyltransferase [Lignipirellula cremea]
MRYGVLGTMLASQGHQVTQWAGTVDHFEKTQRALSNQTIPWNDNYTIELVFGRGYVRHIGPRRIAYHRQAARSFRQRAAELAPPDVIISAIPTIEVSAEAVRYGREHGAAVILDIRDLWPDALFHALPGMLVPLAKLAAAPATRRLESICRQATGLMGVSQSYLEWGQEKAGRGHGEHDRVFPLGYQRRTLDAVEQSAAEAVWRKRGIGPERGFRCCFFGTLGNSTNLDDILTVARRCWNEGDRDVQFVICGEGPNLAEYKRNVAGLQNVVFPGWVSPHEITVLMQWSDMGIAPYSAKAMQSLPNKPIEYLGGGLPVLSTLRGELELLLEQEQCGFTFVPGQADELHRRLVEARGNPSLLAEMKANALRVFADRFDASVVYPQMIAFLKETGDHVKRTSRRAA